MHSKYRRSNVDTSIVMGTRTQHIGIMHIGGRTYGRTAHGHIGYASAVNLSELPAS